MYSKGSRVYFFIFNDPCMLFLYNTHCVTTIYMHYLMVTQHLYLWSRETCLCIDYLTVSTCSLGLTWGYLEDSLSCRSPNASPSAWMLGSYLKTNGKSWPLKCSCAVFMIVIYYLYSWSSSFCFLKIQMQSKSSSSAWMLELYLSNKNKSGRQAGF